MVTEERESAGKAIIGKQQIAIEDQDNCKII